MTNQRIAWLDAIKGYGIILVMISHVDSLGNWGVFLFSSFMPLFFISSGFVAQNEPITIILDKKLKRLLLPYFFYGIIATIFFSIIKTGIYYQGGSVHEWWGVLYSRYCLYHYGHEHNLYFMPIESTSPLWFLTALFSGYILYAIWAPKFNFSFSNCICLFFYIISIWGLSKLPILLPWSFDVAPLIAIFMFIGYLFSHFTFAEWIKRNHCIAIVAISTYLILTHINGFSNLSIREYGQHGIYSIALFFINGILFFIFTVWVFTNMNKKIVSIFAFIGRHSLRLMCIQMPILFCINKFFIKIFKHNKGIEGLTIMCLITISLIISVLLDRLFNKYKTRILYLRYL